MFLIMSGAYVGQELESEFGRIPPSFLPLSNRRLFQHQVALAPQGVKVYLSLPESYAVSEIDHQCLEQHQVTIIATPDGLSLGHHWWRFSILVGTHQCTTVFPLR